MKITIDAPDDGWIYGGYNPCAHCPNNAMINPHASGACCCSLPETYRFGRYNGTAIDSDRWMYEPTVTTTTTAPIKNTVTDYIPSISTTTTNLCTSDSSMFSSTATTAYWR